MQRRKLLSFEKYIYEQAKSFLESPALFTKKEFALVSVLKSQDHRNTIRVTYSDGDTQSFHIEHFLDRLIKNSFRSGQCSNEYKVDDIVSVTFNNKPLYEDEFYTNPLTLLEERAIAAGFESYEAFYNQGFRMTGYEDVEPQPKHTGPSM